MYGCKGAVGKTTFKWGNANFFPNKNVTSCSISSPVEPEINN